MAFDTHITTCSVALPNGDHVVTTLIGLVCLSDSITLHGVLYVPNLGCNLISVTQLNDDNLLANVQFDSAICAIQDQMRKQIGTKVRKDGLYYFCNSGYVSTIEAPSNLELWPRRLGHPSEKVVKMLPHVVVINLI